MGSQDASARGAQAPGEPTAAVLGLWATATPDTPEPTYDSLSGPVRRILRALSQASDSLEGRRQRDPGGMESNVLNLRTRSILFTAAIATTVLGIALLLVYQLVSVSNDPELTRQIGWNLLFIGLSAGILAAGAAWWVVQRINLPLRRLAETMSAMARAGQLRSDFLAAGGGSE